MAVHIKIYVKYFLICNTLFCLFENIDEAQTSFGGTEIIPVAVFYFTTTLAAGIFIVIQISITNSDRRLYAKALIEYPMITIGNTGSVEVALITVVFESQHLDAANVVLGIMCMESEEMSVESFAGPVA